MEVLELNTKEVTYQYRLQKWMEIIRECRSSGQTTSAWCADNNVNIKSYYYWLKRVRLAACETLPALHSTQQQIVPVQLPLSRLDAGVPAMNSPAAIVVRLGAITLELHNFATPALIETTLKALQNVR